MANCSPTDKQLFTDIFQFLITNEKANTVSVSSHVLSKYNCDEDEDEESFNQVYSKISQLMKSQFRVDMFSRVVETSMKRAITSTFGDPCNITKEELVRIIMKVFSKQNNKDDVVTFINENINFQSEVAEEDNDEKDWSEIEEMVNKAIRKNSPTLLNNITLKVLKEYMIEKLQLPISLAKNYQKSELFDILRGNYISDEPSPPASPRMQQKSVQQSRLPGNDVRSYETCVQRGLYTKDQLAEYITKVLKKRLPRSLSSMTKQGLCNFIQDNIDKEDLGKADEQEEEPIRRVSPKRRSVTPPRRVIVEEPSSLDEIEDLDEEIEDLDEEEKVKSCGRYNDYNNENEFFTCEDNEFCDIDEEKCKDNSAIKTDSSVKRRVQNKTLKKRSLESSSGKKGIFLGSKDKLDELKEKFSDVQKRGSRSEQEKREKERQKELERKMREEDLRETEEREREERRQEEERERKEQKKREKEMEKQREKDRKQLEKQRAEEEAREKKEKEEREKELEQKRIREEKKKEKERQARELEQMQDAFERIRDAITTGALLFETDFSDAFEKISEISDFEDISESLWQKILNKKSYKKELSQELQASIESIEEIRKEQERAREKASAEISKTVFKNLKSLVKSREVNIYTNSVKKLRKIINEKLDLNLSKDEFNKIIKPLKEELSELQDTVNEEIEAEQERKEKQRKREKKKEVEEEEEPEVEVEEEEEEKEEPVKKGLSSLFSKSKKIEQSGNIAALAEQLRKIAKDKEDSEEEKRRQKEREEREEREQKEREEREQKEREEREEREREERKKKEQVEKPIKKGLSSLFSKSKKNDQSGNIAALAEQLRKIAQSEGEEKKEEEREKPVEEKREEKQPEKVTVKKPLRPSDIQKKLLASGIKPLPKPVESKKAESIVEQPRTLEEEEFEIDLQSDFQASINFEEVKNKLKNIILDPSSTKILGGKSFLNIPQKISYCVGIVA